MSDQPSYFAGPNGKIAYRRRRASNANKPDLLWLGGFRSDMTGTKASFLDQWANKRGRGFLRFDYSGHGASDGEFENGSIGAWRDDALAVLDALSEGPQLLVGSSMGGWIATLLALAQPERIAAIIFIAPAPDFTERLMAPSFTDAQRRTLEADGRLELASEYADEPEIITRQLIEDGRQHLVMDRPIQINRPVRILQGMKDEAVPYEHALAFAKLIESPDIEVLLTPDGDHRLSTPADLARLARVIDLL